jgi:hypothetical protein
MLAFRAQLAQLEELGNLVVLDLKVSLDQVDH